MDDRYMSAFFNEFDEGVQLVLQIILNKKDLEVLSSKSQITFSNLYGRTIRIDVFARDANGVRYNIEIQKKNDVAGCKRARYHSSMMDANIPEFIGEENFDVLPKSVVIFICEKDFLGSDEPVYTIRRKIEETGELFDDEASIIYVNGEMKTHETELGRLMEDFFNPNPETMNYGLLVDKAKRIKDLDDKEGGSMKIVREYLTEDEWNMAVKEGEDKGINNMIIENIDENVPVEKIVFKLGKYYNLKPDEAMKRIEKEMESRQVL